MCTPLGLQACGHTSAAHPGQWTGSPMCGLETGCSFLVMLNFPAHTSYPALLKGVDKKLRSEFIAPFLDKRCSCGLSLHVFQALPSAHSISVHVMGEGSTSAAALLYWEPELSRLDKC